LNVIDIVNLTKGYQHFVFADKALYDYKLDWRSILLILFSIALLTAKTFVQ